MLNSVQSARICMHTGIWQHPLPRNYDCYMIQVISEIAKIYGASFPGNSPNDNPVAAGQPTADSTETLASSLG